MNTKVFEALETSSTEGITECSKKLNETLDSIVLLVHFSECD